MLETNPSGMVFISLHAGCSTMVKNAAEEAGGSYVTSEEDLRVVVRWSGFRPAKRTTPYDRVLEPGIPVEAI